MGERVIRLDSHELNSVGTFGNFDPEFIVPSQYFGKIDRGPCYDLLARIMDSALDDIRGRQNGEEKKRIQRIASEAVDWVLSNEVWVFSFVFCCQHLNWDIKKTRAIYMANYMKGIPSPATSR